MRKTNDTGTPEERFWHFVKKGKNEDDCWAWIGTKIPSGYSQIWCCGKMVNAHRFSYELHFGKIPKGKIIMHKCDNPQCCNPKHLEVGTYKDNTQDMLKKGRTNQPKGEKHCCAKLTQKQVVQIRKLHKTGRFSQIEIGRKFNVGQNAICSIVNNKTWKICHEEKK
ncbi:MAG: HNH endonuclease [Candidatus Gracilibacteria bacterium]|jgi:hypothetical protein